MPVPNRDSTTTRPVLTPWLILGVALLTLGGTIGYFIGRERAQIDTLERERLTTQAKVVDANVERQLVALDLALLGIRNDLPYRKTQQNSPALVNRHLQALSEAMPGVRTLLITDADGTVTASNRAPLLGVNFREREYFRTAQQGRNPATLYITPPFKTASGVYSLNLVRVRLDARGTFAGIVAATLDPEFFTALLNSVLYAPGMRASLIHGHGKIFVEVPDRGDLSGMDLAKPGSRYTLHVQSGRPANLFAAGTAYSTGDARMSAWRTIRPAAVPMDMPLMVTVNRDMSGIFAPWRREAVRQGGLFGVLVLVTVAGLYFSQRQRQQSETTRKQAEEALRESEARFDQLATQSRTIVWEVDAQGRYTYVSQVAEAVLGYRPDELVGRMHIYDLHPEQGREAFTTAALAVFARQEPFQDLLNAIQTKDGRQVWVSTNGLPLLTADGTLRGYRGSDTDITARKHLEAEKAQLEAQTQHLQKAESLGRMAGGIAHHFNNQLQAVLGNLELALDALPPAAAAPGAWLTEALQAASRAAELSGLMLTYLGQTPSTRAPLDLAAACRRTLPLLQAALPTPGVLESDLPAPGPVVCANAAQIHQVLTNLVTNAWEAGGSAPGVIQVSVTTAIPAEIPAAHRVPLDWQPQDPAYACLAVADTGCGIALEDMDTLFDPFFSTKFPGRGMGLAVVLGIVRAHAGAITLESAPGRGSSFRVYLPLTADPLPRPPELAAPAPARHGGGTVLVVDDEALVRRLVAAMLTHLGFPVLTATDGVEAVEAFRRHHDDIRCVLCDLTMPRMDGWATLTALRQLAPGLPVILASGYSPEQVLAGPHPDRPQAFLGKPYRLQDLRDALRHALAAPTDPAPTAPGGV